MYMCVTFNFTDVRMRVIPVAGFYVVAAGFAPATSSYHQTLGVLCQPVFASASVADYPELFDVWTPLSTFRFLCFR